MDISIQGSRPITTLVVCHPNRVLVSLGKLQAERQGMRVFVARDGNDVIVQARRRRPELIVLGDGLRNPSTADTIEMIERDPLIKSARVVSVKGAIPDLRNMLGRKPGP